MNNYSFELNNARNDAMMSTGKITEKSPVVEIFSAMAKGEELAKYGKKADVAAKYIMDLGKKAQAGDFVAMSEINEIRKFVMQPQLLQEIKLLGLFGSYKPLGWGETAQIEKITYENVRADFQAEGQDVSTAFARRTKEAIAPVTISAGHKVNYRELALGDLSTEMALMEEVRKEIRNKASLYVLETVFKAVENATGVKYFYENASLAKSNVDEMLKDIRRYGKPNVHGDYALLAQFIPWIGYAGQVGGQAVTGVSQKALEEIADNGIVGSYNGAILKEIENGYNFAKLTEDGSNYETILPAGLGIVTPTANGGLAPVQSFTIGGMTSFTGNSVATGEILTRFDLSVAAGVADPSKIAIIHDSNLDTL